jgi:hypothetical protein
MFKRHLVGYAQTYPIGPGPPPRLTGAVHDTLHLPLARRVGALVRVALDQARRTQPQKLDELSADDSIPRKFTANCWLDPLG